MGIPLNAKIYIAGHNGLVGSAILRHLQAKGYTNLLMRTSSELDLRNQNAVQMFFQKEKPEYVFLCAAKVGGIAANASFPADFIYQNLMIQTNVIQSAQQVGVKRLLFLGSSCIYPKMSPQPIKEEYLLSGSLEPTNQPYAIAKIAGIELCTSYNKQLGTQYICAMPTNLYGPNDNYDLQNSHVLPALIRKMHEASKNKTPVTLWGTGTARREFLHCDDLAQACVHLLSLPESSYQRLLGAPIVNIGCGEDVTIKELSDTVADVVGFKGEIVWDKAKPDGTPRKLLDISKIKSFGWHPTIFLAEGIKMTYLHVKDKL